MLQLMKSKGSGWVLLCPWLPLALWAPRRAAISPHLQVCLEVIT